MAITNPEAIRFCNERVRVAASHLAQVYFLAKAVSAEWTANNMGALIPVDGGDVEDGSASDGRHVITGNDATGVILRLNELIADYEAAGGAKLNTILAVAVEYP
jgi:hypothetical protein